ncbi:MAG: hypothetical protein M1837_001912 [Sclerophora amabilis]|nr:MAG: hypothetical protein M1837_001912 [Sclerophora amabilis]
MAPAAVPAAAKTDYIVGQYKELALGPKGYQKEIEEEGSADQPKAKFTSYLPTWDPSQKYPPLEPFEHYEHGKDADPAFPDLLRPGVTQTDLTPTIGTEISGVQLSSLTKEGKDQLALFAAKRRVVVFRDQDFADLPVGEALDYGNFGRPHIHPTSGSPEGYPEVHVVHRGAGDNTISDFFASRTSSVAWHSDVSYEQQPPGTTFLYILDKPESGGDTLFASGVEAYNRLSPAFRERLHGLQALHSGHDQAEASRSRGGIVRREPTTSVHPIVRTHPATGEKALYVNPQFTRSIVGYKREESDALLKFLYDHIAYGADFQARVKWAEKSVVVWDNRVTMHSAIIDWTTGARRHLARVTPQAEKPSEN